MKGIITQRSKLGENKVGIYRIEVPIGPNGTFPILRETIKGTKEQAEKCREELLDQLVQSGVKLS